MSGERWHADIQITEELVKNCLQDQFPSLTPIEKIECIGEGWDNKVFLVNKKIIFRFPRRKIAVELIERENKVLKNLQSILSIEIPNPKYIGQPTSHYSYSFHGYKMIKGTSGCHAQLNDQDRITSLAPLSIFLKQLHSINENQALAMGAKPQVYDRTEVNKVVETLNERVEKIVTRKLCSINKDYFKDEMRIAQTIELPSEKCLVHGDLYCRHLMFNKGQLTGIIDWGDVGINNRSVDLSVIWSFYPNSCHKKFLETYGPVDPATWQYARFLGLYSALTMMIYANDIGDPLLVKEAIDAIKRIRRELLFDE